ncbi:hypothetical protein C8Q76DRAFT_692220 [Earliella scabrosa]|nr:hypothetical protein C8Q76DRAFT_692220 [Earliella scabrosa]
MSEYVPYGESETEFATNPVISHRELLNVIRGPMSRTFYSLQYARGVNCSDAYVEEIPQRLYVNGNKRRGPGQSSRIASIDCSTVNLSLGDCKDWRHPPTDILGLERQAFLSEPYHFRTKVTVRFLFEGYDAFGGQQHIQTRTGAQSQQPTVMKVAWAVGKQLKVFMGLRQNEDFRARFGIKNDDEDIFIQNIRLVSDGSIQAAIGVRRSGALYSQYSAII